MEQRQTCSRLFPYTTLFRSDSVDGTTPNRGTCRTHRSHAAPDCHTADTSRSTTPRAGRAGSRPYRPAGNPRCRSEEHTSELQSHSELVCRLLLEKKN